MKWFKNILLKWTEKVKEGRKKVTPNGANAANATNTANGAEDGM